MALTEKMEKYLVSSHEEAKNIVRELCRIPAPSHHEEKRAAWCEQWFRQAGGKKVFVDEALNAVCEHNVTEDNDVVVMMAHIDTVFPDLEPMPFEEKDGLFYSPGVTDDTGNLASLLIAVRYVLQNDIKTSCGMVFVANSCEEGLGNLKGSRRVMDDYAGRVRNFVTLDSTCMNRLITKAVGSHRYKVAVRTEGGHSYGNFGNRNAIHALAAMISLLYSIKVPVDGDSKTTYNVGTISGGTSVNTIAQNAEMLYEYRSTSRKCLARMEEFFLKTVETFKAAGVEVEVEKVGDRPCSGEVNGEALEALRKRYRDSVTDVLALETVDGAGSTDCNIPLSRGVPAICFGVVRGSGVHTRDEKIETASLHDGCRLLLDFLYRP